MQIKCGFDESQKNHQKRNYMSQMLNLTDFQAVLEDSNNLFKDISPAHEAVLILDRYTNIQSIIGDINPLTSAEKSDPKGKPFKDLFHNKEYEKIEALFKSGNFSKTECTLIISKPEPVAVGISCHRNATDQTYVIFLRNINNFLQNQLQLSESERNYRTLFHNSPLPNIIYELEHFQILEANEQAAKHFGICREKLKTMTLMDIRPEEETDVVRHKHQNINAIEEVINFGVCTFQNSSQEILQMDVTGMRIKYNGQDCMITEYLDVTESEKNIASLRSSEERYRALQESLTSYMVRVDLSGKYTYVNKKFYTDFVAKGTEIIGSYATSILMEYHMERLVQTVKNCIAEPGKVIQVELDKPGVSGKVIHTLWEFLCLLDADGIPSEIQCVGLDITDRKIAERELQESNERYNALNLVTKDAIYEWDLINNELKWGPGMERIFGHRALSIQEWEKQLHPQDKLTTVEGLNKFLESPISNIWKQEYRLKKTDLSYANVEEIGWLERDENKKPVRMIGVLRDVTAARSLERMLKTSTSMSLLGAFEAIVEDDYHLWSPMAREIFEFGQDEVITVAKIMGSHKGRWHNQLKDGLNKLMISPGNTHFEILIVTKSGAEKWLNVNIQSEKIFGGKTKLYGSFQDISDRKNAELRFKSLANNVPGVLYQYRLSVDGAEELSMVSNKSVDIWGYTPDEVCKNPGLIWKGLELGGKLNESITAIHESRDNLTPIRLLIPYVKPNGTKVWHELYGQPRRLSDGSVIWNSIILDVTSERDALMLADRVKKIAKLGIWDIVVQNGKVKKVTLDPTYYEILGTQPSVNYSVDDLLGMAHAKYKPKVRQLLENLIANDHKEELELEIETLHGEYKWVKVIGQSDFANGQCIRIFGSLQDITEAKLAELDLSNKTKYLAALAQISSELLELENWDDTLDTCLRIAGNTVQSDRVYYFENHTDTQNGDQVCSQRYEWVKGNIKPEINNPELQNLSHESIGAIFRPLQRRMPFKAIIEELPDSPIKELLSSQDILSILILPVFIGEVFAGFIGFDDCTRKHHWTKDEEHFLKSIADNIASAIQRHNARENLHQALVEKESILNNIRDGFTELSKQYIIQSWNPRAVEITGFTSQQMIGNNIWEVFGTQVKEHFLKIAESQKESSVIIYEQFYRDLNKFIEVNVYPSESGFSIFFRDITEKRLAEDEIRASEEKYRVLVESSDAAIMMVDSNGVFQYINEVGARPFQSNPQSPFYHRKSLVGLSTEELFPPEQSALMMQNLRDVLKNNQGSVNENQIELAGNTYWYRSSLQPVRNKEGIPTAALIISTNITESKIAQEKIRQSEEQYRVLVESADAIIFTADMHGNFLFINEIGAKSLGKKPEEIIGKNHKELFSAAHNETFMLQIGRVFETGKGTVQDTESILGDKKYWFHVRILPLKNADGVTTSVLVNTTNITDQKRAEQQIISNERKYRFLFEESPHALMISKGEIFMEVNKAAEQLFGYTAEEMRSLTPEHFSPEYQPNGRKSEEMVPEMVQEVMIKGSHEFDWMHRNKNGSNFMSRISLNKATYENEEVIFAMVRDMTQTIKAESELSKFREIADQANHGTVILENGEVQYCNQAFAKMHGYDLSELLGKDYRLFIPDESKNQVTNIIFNKTDQLFDIKSAEGAHLRKDGIRFPVLINLKEITTRLNQRFMSISVIDMTELNKMRQENRQLNIAIEQSPVAMIVTNLNSVIEYCSPAFTTITGYEPHEVIGRSIGLVKSGLMDSKTYAELWESLKNGKVWEGQFINKRKDGSLYYEHDTISPILNDQGEITHYLAIKQDITEAIHYQNSLKELNEELETQKKELEQSNKELEQFAYVASHDLQEPLRMVTSFMSQLEKKYKEVLDEKGQQYIYFAVDGAKRMRKIILDLLDYSRVGRMNGDLTEIDLNSLIEEVLQLQNKRIEETEAQIKYDKLPVIISYYTPVLQIFHNLVSNALKYISEERRPVVSISYEEMPSEWIFRIQDNGIGIAEEYFQKIFVIFQRLQTATTHEGTGMGLAIVKKHVETLNGHITVESKVDEGSTFIFSIKKINS